MLRTLIITTISLLVCTGCNPHRSIDVCLEEEILPMSFCHDRMGVKLEGQWWEEFQDERLNELINEAFCDNLSLSQAWHRLTQAKEQVTIQSAGKIPALDLTGSVNYSRRSGGTIGSSSSFNFPGSSTRYAIAPTLSYELDLWRKIDASVRASFFTAEAARQEVYSTALTLSGSVATSWFEYIEQVQFLKLLNHQVEVNQTFLELIELRFSVGEASALDVYQQRLQLAQTEAQVPPIRSSLETTHNALQILLGKAPTCVDWEKNQPTFPKLPVFPELSVPCDLLLNRPDLRQSLATLRAADEEVAVAVADRFPQVNLLLSYELSALQAGTTLEQQLFSAVGSLVAPLFDSGKRKAEVNRTKAVVCEKFDAFRAAVLIALQEVEDAIVIEREQIALLERLEIQKGFAEDNLNEARLRYATGLDDYLSVIAAIQSLQAVERRYISETANLLQNRGNLYRALGGTPLQ